MKQLNMIIKVIENEVGKPSLIEGKIDEGFVFTGKSVEGYFEYANGDRGFLYNPKTDKIVFEYEEEVVK